MFKPTVLVVLLLLFFKGYTQQISLPADLRQHTLTHYNASLFNAAFSLDRNNPQSVSLWTRWQWQTIDADPTTLFLNYTRTLNDNSAAAVGFFQQNTGVYFNTGGALNYAYQLEFNRLIKVSFGANAFLFKQEIADTRFSVNPIPGIPQSIPTDDFVLQFAPGVNIQVENFSLSLASENLFDYNFTDKITNTAKSDKIFMGMASYDFPIISSDDTAFLRPSLYLRTIPGQDNQVGLDAQLNTKKFWVQSGYNNFYGISIGGGGTFFNRFSLGALVEFGNSSSLNSKDPSFEFLASYYLGKKPDRRPLVASGVLELDQQVGLQNEDANNERIKEELEKAEKLANEEETIENENSESESSEELSQPSREDVKEARKEAKRLAAEEKAIRIKQRKDSIDLIKKEREALALQQKQEQELAKKAADEAKLKAEEEAKIAKLEEEAAKIKAEEEQKLAEAQEEEKRLAAEKLAEDERIAEENRITEENRLTEANRIAEEEKQKELQRQEEIEKARLKGIADKQEELRKLDSINDARKAAALAAERRVIEEKRRDSIEQKKKADALAEAQRIEEQQRQEAIQKAKEEKALALKEAEQRIQDSISAAQSAQLAEAELRLKELRKLDSISRAERLRAQEKTEEPITPIVVEEVETAEPVIEKAEPEVITLEKGEKYEQVDTEDGLEPGFYLIANVFRTKKYFDIFMTDLTNKGLQPKSFYRSVNKYNYAYLERYNTMREARRARDSNFYGKYDGNMWIFGVVVE
jgi:type IX secretion system PorP/SprF family membrane protein